MGFKFLARNLKLITRNWLAPQVPCAPVIRREPLLRIFLGSLSGLLLFWGEQWGFFAFFFRLLLFDHDRVLVSGVTKR